MEIISKISKGTKMDQIYLPKNRHGFGIGTHVTITPVHVKEKEGERPYFYNIPSLEPVKVQIIQQLFELIDQHSNTYENIIVTGSFLENGFQFHDVDILLISEEMQHADALKKEILSELGIKPQIILITNKQLLQGLATDPLYEMMLSRCVAKKRFIYKTEKKINYKLLDIHLLKSKTLAYNFDLLDGSEKWYLARNMICISLFLQDKKITLENVEEEIKKQLGASIQNIKKNMLMKNEFLQKYKKICQKIFMQILYAIKHDTKQKQAS